MNNTIRIGIIDPHDIVRQSLKIFLETTHDLLFVGEASSESETLSMCRQEKPDVVLFDFLQTDAQGLKLIASLHCVFPTLYIIVLTTVMTPRLIIQALLAGAVGYFYKQVDIDTLADAIRAAAKGKPVFDEEVQTILRAQAPTQVWVSAGVN
jgi:DNA-binding NarL/FixJ family response regulator